jgi:hypothetical protein
MASTQRRKGANTAWAAAAETAGRTRGAPEWRAARTTYKLLPPALQLRLVEEIVEARSHDFIQGFDNVVAVHAGVRRRRDKAGRERLGTTPCVIFVVRRKWPTPDHGRPAQRLPAELLAHADVDGRRHLCAVPTDVQHIDPLVRARAQARTRLQTAVQVPVAGAAAQATGTLAWPLRVGGNQIVLLAPLHVFSPLPNLQHGGCRAGAQGRAFDAQGLPRNGPVLFTTLNAGGQLLPWPALSFDAQLAAVNDMADLRSAFQGLPISASRPFLRSTADVLQASAGAGLQILVPDNFPGLGGQARTLAAAYSRNITRETPLVYRTAGGLESFVAHHLLIELQIKLGNRTFDGDSGSAVVTPAPDGFTLAGMHIAGNSDTGLSFMLPAWQLFDSLFYHAVPDGLIEPVSV